MYIYKYIFYYVLFEFSVSLGLLLLFFYLMGIIKEYCCEAQEPTPYCSIEPKLFKEKKSVYILSLVWKLFVHTAKYHKGGIIVKVNV